MSMPFEMGSVTGGSQHGDGVGEQSWLFVLHADINSGKVPPSSFHPVTQVTEPTRSRAQIDMRN